MNKQQALLLLKKNKDKLNRQQLRTIKGQIISGNITGAMKGLERVLGK
ncbi:MAG: hypothetical protein RRY26_11725 [Cellulosilyticaceae bacterium]